MALKVGELFASFNLDTSGLNGAISSAEKSLSSIGKGLTIGGAAMTAAITRPIVNAAKEIYAAGAGFNAQMSRVFAIRGLDSSVAEDVDAMNVLRQEALRMAAATKFSTEEAGQAFEYMAMAGWDVDNMLAGLEPVMNLAIASGNDLARVSDIVTDAMTAFGLAADGTTKVFQNGEWIDVNNVQHFSDVLAAVSTNANTNVDLMGETFKYVASLAGAMGYSIEDVGMAIGLMANSGVKGSQAGTSLKNILTRLAAPTDEVAGAMEQLGISLDDGKGNMKPLRQVMQDLRKGFGGLKISQEEFTFSMADLDSQLASGKMTQKQYDNAVEDLTKKAFGAEGALKAEAAAAIAGKYGLAGLLAIVSATDEDFEKLMESVDNCNGATEKMGKTMSDNAAGDVMRLQSAINVLYTDLWMLGENGFRKVVQEITGMINGFQQLAPEIKMGAMRILALAAATGPAMIGMGTMLLALPKIAAAIAGLVSPVGLLAIGFVALGAAAIDEGNTIGKTLEAMAAKAGSEFPKIGKAARAEIPKLETNMSALLSSVRTSIEKAIPGMAEGIGDLIITAATVLSDEMPDIAKTATTFISTLSASIAKMAPEVLASVGSLALSMAAEIIRAQPEMLKAGLTLLGGIIEAAGQIKWADVGTQIHDAIRDSLSGVKTNFYTFLFGKEPKAEELGDWKGIGSKVGSLIIASIKTALGSGKDLIGGLTLGDDYTPDTSWETIGKKIRETIMRGLANGAAFVNGITGEISKALSDLEVSGLAENMGKASADLLHAILTGITEFGNNPDVQSFMINLGDGISSAMHFLGNIAGDIVAYIVSPEGLMDIYNAGLALGKILLTGLTSVVGGIGSFLNGLVESALVSWGVLDGDELKAAKEAGNTLATTTAQAFEQAAASGTSLDAGTQLLANMANVLAGNLTGMDSAAFDQARNFRDALKSAVNYATDPESFRDEVSTMMEALSGETIDLPFFDDLDFWGKLYEAVASGNASEIMTLVNDILAASLADGGQVEEAAAEAAGAYPEAVQAVMDQLDLSTEKGASQGGGIEQTMKNASEQGMAGYEAGILEGQEGATGAAAQVSDAAVQVFLLAMSEENGTTIGAGFVTGMTTGITNQTGALTQAAQLAANRVVAAAYSTASGGAGWTIGHNFGQGFVNGIRSMISAAASAASSLGSAAGHALSSATQEGSPSEWTTKIGRNFGAGFFNGIMALAGAVAGAASSLGQSAGNALSMTARDMGQSTVGSMQAPSWAGGSGSSAAPSETRSQEPALERFTGMIVSALEHVAVQMDSETVGHLVVDTVSEDIAHRASTRRAAIA